MSLEEAPRQARLAGSSRGSRSNSAQPMSCCWAPSTTSSRGSGATKARFPSARELPRQPRCDSLYWPIGPAPVPILRAASGASRQDYPRCRALALLSRYPADRRPTPIGGGDVDVQLEGGARVMVRAHPARGGKAECPLAARPRARPGRRAALFTGPARARGAGRAVTVSPLPGTPDAIPATQISILGTPAVEHRLGRPSPARASGAPQRPSRRPTTPPRARATCSTRRSQKARKSSVVVALKEGGTIEDHFTVAHLGRPRSCSNAEGEKPESPRTLQDRARTAAAEGARQPRRTRASKGDFFLDPLPAPTIHVGAKLLEFEPVGPRA